MCLSTEHQTSLWHLLTGLWVAFCCLLLFTCCSVTEPGVPYNVTVRARTAAGLGEPVSIVVFAVQQGNIEQTAEGCVRFEEYDIICNQCHYFSHARFECAIIAIRLLLDLHLHTQLPLCKWAMWRWSGWTTTELPLSVGPHSPSIRQEVFLCTLWHINPLHKLGKWCVLSTLSTPLTQVWWLVTLTQTLNTISLLMLAQ